MESWLLIWRLKGISHIHPPGGSVVKNPPANAGDTRDTGSIPGSGKSPYRKWQTTAVFLPGKSHGQRSLARYTVQGVTKSQTRLSIHTHTHYCILKRIPSKDLLYSTGNLLNIMQRSKWEKFWKRIDTCITESFCWIPETVVNQHKIKS